MLNDYKGELTEFALVVPVPQVLQRGQVNVGDRRIFDRIDAYRRPASPSITTPTRARCAAKGARRRATRLRDRGDGRAADAAKALGVTVEASYTVGEYDIVMLSATQSDGLRNLARAERLPNPARRRGGARSPTSVRT